MSDIAVDQLVEMLMQWFDKEHWIVERADKSQAVAIMPAEDGSITIDITALAEFLHEFRP